MLLSGRMGCCSQRRVSVTGACIAAVCDDAEGPFPSLPDGWLCTGWFLAPLFSMTKQCCILTLSNKGEKKPPPKSIPLKHHQTDIQRMTSWGFVHQLLIVVAPGCICIVGSRRGTATCGCTRGCSCSHPLQAVSNPVSQPLDQSFSIPHSPAQLCPGISPSLGQGWGISPQAMAAWCLPESGAVSACKTPAENSPT